MPTPAELAWIDAINRGASPEGIQNYAGAVGSGIPPEVASDPTGYGYDYGADPTGLGGQRNIAFSDTNSYDYRTDPSYLALTRSFDFQKSEAERLAAQQTGNLDVLQPVSEADIMANQENALRSVDQNAESRGIYQSGERLQNRARTTGDYGRQLTGVQLTGALSRGNVQSDLAAALAEIERRRTDTQAGYATPPLPGAPSGSF